MLLLSYQWDSKIIVIIVFLFLIFTIATTPEQVIARVVGAGWRHRQSLLFVPVTDLIALHEAGVEAGA